MGYGYSGYGYSHGYGPSPIDIIFDGLGVLAFLGIIAAVVLTVFGYVRLIGKKAERGGRLGACVRFEHFHIGSMLQTLYLFLGVVVTVVSALIPLANALIAGVGDSSVLSAIGGLFSGLLGGVLFFVVCQVVLRVVFELLMLLVRMSDDTRALREKLVGMEPPRAFADDLRAADPVTLGAEMWDCPCGCTGNVGSVCRSCGRPRY